MKTNFNDDIIENLDVVELEERLENKWFEKEPEPISTI